VTDLRSVPDAPDAPDGADPRAALPQVDALVRDLPDLVAEAGRTEVADAVRTVLDRLRGELRPGDPAPAPETVRDLVTTEVRERREGGLVAVVNATGVVLHTGMGRAPLSAAAREAVQVAAGYSDVELDLATGERGSRTRHVGALAARACGTEAATVVNNGAGALLLVLAALAGGREVVVSRGELIEIGGSYRLPDVMAAAGVDLVEVGTTNRTRLADHEHALGPATGLLLKVHRSNFAIVGFTEEASLADLVALGHEHDLPVVHDLGSGLLVDPPAGSPLAGEPSVAASVAAGADLVIVSGDKLLGGPQAGIIAGRADLVAACGRHPLARALRIDALQRAALEATLEAHLRDPVPQDLPTLAMLHTPTEELHARATALAGALAGVLGGGSGGAAGAGGGGGGGAGDVPAAVAEVVATSGRVGGGAHPTRELPSWAVALPGPAEALATALRAGDPPVVGRIVDDRVLIDLRTVPPAGDEQLAELIRAALGRVTTSTSGGSGSAASPGGAGAPGTSGEGGSSEEGGSSGEGERR
jgi:L-seryl-tRNA(Ser) seleniumtransferase